MTETPDHHATPDPADDLAELNRLIGTWQLGGDTEGTVTYEWMDGGHFLIQHVDMGLGGHQVKCIEIIGHHRPFGAEPSPEIRSRAYDSLGNTLDYVYEMDGDTLIIWGGEKGSSSFFRGTFSADGNRNDGAWEYPGGGGYTSTMTRLR